MMKISTKSEEIKIMALFKSKTKEKKVVVNELLYKLLLNTPFRRSIEFIHQKLLLICPYEPAILQNTAADIVNKAAIVGSIAAYAAFAVNTWASGGITTYSIASAAFVAYAACCLVTHSILNKIQKEVNEDFRTYISRVEKTYENTHSMINSIPLAAAEMSGSGIDRRRVYNIERFAQEISELLWAENAAERVKEYVSDRHRPSYVRLFVTQVYKFREKGDTSEKSELIKKNLEKIRLDIKSDEIKQTRRAYSLKGMEMMLIIPVVGFSFLGRWGKSFSPESEGYYRTYGLILQIATLATAWLLFQIVNRSKDITSKIYKNTTSFYSKLSTKLKLDTFTQKHGSGIAHMLAVTGDNTPVPVFVTKMILWAVTGVVAVSIIFGYTSVITRHKILTTETVEELAVTTQQRNAVVSAIVDLSLKHKSEDITNYSDDVLLTEINSVLQQNGVRIANKYVLDQITAELIKRNTEYRNQSISIAQLFAILAASAIGLIPYFELRYYYNLCLSEKDNEIKMFQNLILMEKDFPSTTVGGLLNEMESHSLIFNSVLSKTTMEYLYNRESAIRLLQVNQPYEISDIADSFLAARKVGIKSAFSSIEADMAIHEKELDLEKEISISKERNYLSVLCYIPAVIAVIGNFILPFLVTSLQGLDGVFETLKELEGFGL
jgi:hypothetical protein